MANEHHPLLKFYSNFSEIYNKFSIFQKFALEVGWEQYLAILSTYLTALLKCYLTIQPMIE